MSQVKAKKATTRKVKEHLKTRDAGEVPWPLPSPPPPGSRRASGADHGARGQDQDQDHQDQDQDQRQGGTQAQQYHIEAMMKMAQSVKELAESIGHQNAVARGPGSASRVQGELG